MLTYPLYEPGRDPLSPNRNLSPITTGLDKEGRFLLPEELKDYANIKNEAAFFGQGHFPVKLLPTTLCLFQNILIFTPGYSHASKVEET